jgi:hypothetical protein
MPARTAAEAGMDFSGQHNGDHTMTTEKVKEIEIHKMEVFGGGAGSFQSNRPRSTTAEHAAEARKLREHLAYRWHERDAERTQNLYSGDHNDASKLP